MKTGPSYSLWAKVSAGPRADKGIQGRLPKIRRSSEVQENKGGLSLKGSVKQREGEMTGSPGRGRGWGGRGGAGQGWGEESRH